MHKTRIQTMPPFENGGKGLFKPDFCTTHLPIYFKMHPFKQFMTDKENNSGEFSGLLSSKQLGIPKNFRGLL